jgi:SOS response regulatory protein OraA/RecX
MDNFVNQQSQNTITQTLNKTLNQLKLDTQVIASFTKKQINSFKVNDLKQELIKKTKNEECVSSYVLICITFVLFV